MYSTFHLYATVKRRVMKVKNWWFILIFQWLVSTMKSYIILSFQYYIAFIQWTLF